MSASRPGRALANSYTKRTSLCAMLGATGGSVQPLRSYIVRIYRQGARTLTGIVEDPRSGITRPFETPEDLWAALRAPRAGRKRAKPRAKSPS